MFLVLGYDLIFIFKLYNTSVYPHHLLYTTDIKPIEIDIFPSLAVITIDIIFTLDIIYSTYFDWIKYFIYNTNKCTIDACKCSSVSLLRVSESLSIYSIASVL